MKSSSFHTISADKNNFFYKVLVRLVYFPFNWINNMRPLKNVDKKLKITQFKLNDFESHYHKIEKTASPSRKLSNLFWMNYNWEELQNTLGKINICDLGCGSGNYYKKIQEYSGNRINRYFGLDVYENKNWKSLKSISKNIDFKQYDGKNIFNLIPTETNLIISQSAIEHFKEDITIFKQIRSFVETCGHQVCQIHLFPSAVCLKLYRFHGIRQYTPRTISKITKLFTGLSYSVLTTLGAENSIKTHIKYITKSFGNGKDIREIKKEEYNTVCYDAIKNDILKKNDVENAAFYALVIT